MGTEINIFSEDYPKCYINTRKWKFWKKFVFLNENYLEYLN